MSNQKNNRRKHDTPKVGSAVGADVQSIINILVEPPKKVGARNKNASGVSEQTLRAISDKIAEEGVDVDSLLQTLPDIELTKELLVSSIISPKDMMTTELTFGLDDTPITGEGLGSVIKIIADHFKKDYPLPKLLPKMLRDILFYRGNYTLLVLPQNTIDKVINGNSNVSMESFADQFTSEGVAIPTGLLGVPKVGEEVVASVGMENLFSPIGTASPIVDKERWQLNSFTTICDNPSILKVPKIVERVTNQKVSDRLGMSRVSLEAFGTVRDKTDAENNVGSFYKKRTFKKSNFVPIPIPNENEEGKGNPLVMKLPAECIIPVHVPSNPEEHIAYFILLDKAGNPLHKVTETNYYKELNSRLKSGNELTASELIESTRQKMFGEGKDKVDKSHNDKAYAELVEKDLIRRLKSGVYGDNVEISNVNEVSRIMLARALSNMHTTVLLVPAELCTYMAFRYNSVGVGKTLLEDTKILASLRAMMLFSNTMGAIRNSIPHTSIDINLDPDDPDPESTVEEQLVTWSKNHQTEYPLGTTNPSDITTFIQTSNTDVNVEGNDRYPGTKVEISDSGRSIQPIDSELEDKLKERHITAMGMSPEIVDSSFQADFAASIVGSNLMLAKNAMGYQDQTNAFLEDFARKYVSHSEQLRNEIKEVVSKSKDIEKPKDLSDEQIVQTIIDAITISLPKPDVARLNNMSDAIQSYSDMLDTGIEAYISTDMLSDQFDGNVADIVDPLKAQVKGYLMRLWLRKNNAIPELDDLVQTDADGDKTVDVSTIIDNHNDIIMKFAADLLSKAKKADRKIDRRLEKEEEEEERKIAEKEEEEERKRQEEEEKNNPTSDIPPEDGGDDNNDDNVPNPEEGEVSSDDDPANADDLDDNGPEIPDLS